MSGEQAIFNLQIKKKSGLSLNPDIHHSKVFSSEQITLMKGLASNSKVSTLDSGIIGCRNMVVR